MKHDKTSAKKKSPLFKAILWSVVGLVALVIVISALSGGSNGTNNSDKSNGSSQKKEAESMKVGESVTKGDLTHTLLGARWDNGDGFLAPDSGTRWLVVDVELKNNGDESASISTLLMWKLLDSEKRSADIQVGAKTNGSLDGELAAGRTLRGEMAFTVPANGDKWELLFEPNVLGFGQSIYTIDAADIK